MDAEMIPGLYPLGRCKTLHLVRHAEGFHNVEGEKDFKAYLSYDLLDAQLTPLGWQQARIARHLHIYTRIAKILV
ncbi:hypothetical protein SAY86_015511 [Trapa natans]|uniref:Phosphoglycerate mutase-like protein n=1 Tax=Trapa natans TaxID=22666 RepID=A0AAN7LC47_TRANT|nr:hypothetical protein SAY86_015511 [Trapa natans]